MISIKNWSESIAHIETTTDFVYLETTSWQMVFQTPDPITLATYFEQTDDHCFAEDPTPVPIRDRGVKKKPDVMSGSTRR